MAETEPRVKVQPKEIRRLNDQVSALEKLNTRLQTKSEAAAIELARVKGNLETKEKELTLMRKNFAKYGSTRSH